MIDFLKGKTEKVVEDIKRMPKMNPRGINEVSEDSIATFSIEEIQRILKEDINIVYNALVASDYIEEIAKDTTQRNTSQAYQNPQKYAG